MKENGTTEISQSVKLIDLAVRPQIKLLNLRIHLQKLGILNGEYQDNDVLESLEVEIKYNGYLERERLVAEKIGRLENVKIPNGYNFSKIDSLSTEARIKLNRIKPTSIGQASRISGISPSDINVLLIYLGR